MSAADATMTVLVTGATSGFGQSIARASQRTGTG